MEEYKLACVGNSQCSTWNLDISTLILHEYQSLLDKNCRDFDNGQVLFSITHTHNSFNYRYSLHFTPLAK